MLSPLHAAFALRVLQANQDPKTVQLIAAGMEEGMVAAITLGRGFSPIGVSETVRTSLATEGRSDGKFNNFLNSVFWILRELSSNVDDHVSGRVPVEITVGFSEKAGQNPTRRFIIQYRDESQEPWRIPIREAAVGSSRKLPIEDGGFSFVGGDGLTWIRKTAEFAGGFMIIEARDTDSTRRRLKYVSGDTDLGPESLDPRHSIGTEILIEVPMPVTGSSLASIAESMRTELAGLEERDALLRAARGADKDVVWISRLSHSDWQSDIRGVQTQP